VSVASHLAVTPRAYDRRIRALIPWYGELLDAAAASLAYAVRPIQSIADLGIGTGALTQRCLRVAPRARVIGIDADAAMLAVARQRLRGRRRATLVHEDFTAAALPRCDAIVASFALHHIRSPRAKAAFYGRCIDALGPGGVLISADCFPPASPQAWARDTEHWVSFLAREFGTRQKARRVLDSWSDEDTYVRLDYETEMLKRAGFTVDVPWRRSPFGVLVGVKETR
jgi:SAM-dependent methyltransferase